MSLVSSLQPPTFISSVAREIKQYYAAQGREPHVRANSRLAQFWWGDVSSIHYELWIHDRTLQLELGLHFESSAATNQRILQAFSPHLLEIQDELGDSIWLEDWDKGWTRIYETQPLYPMDEARVIAVAGRLCEIMDCLQPMLESLAF
jgi:hypothetical protein